MEAVALTEIYAVFYNFIADYIVLSMVRRDLFPETGKKRTAGGAAAGAVTYVCWSYFERRVPYAFYVTGGILIVGTLLCLVFKIHSVRSLGRTAALLLACLFVLGGLVYFFREKAGAQTVFSGYNLVVMAAGGVIISFFTGQKKKEKRQKRNLYVVRVFRKGRQIVCTGLYDSGNLLKSTLNNRGVFVIDRQIADRLLTPEEKIIFSKIYDIKNYGEEKKIWNILAENLCSGISLVQYHSVGKESGMLPGVAAEKILVEKDGKILADTAGILAVSREKLSAKGQFFILLPADIF